MTLPIIVAGAAALAIVMIALGLAGASRDDPLRARLSQLGAMTKRIAARPIGRPATT
jgi:hypothetical protein